MYRETGRMPEALRRRPGLYAYDQYFLEAFYELHSGRPVHEFPQPVSTAELLAWCQLAGVDGLEERARVCRMVRRLDAAYLTYAFKKHEEARGSKAGG